MQQSQAAANVSGNILALDAVARRYGFSVEAAESMLRALRAGDGGMAQFDHPEFGGRGQWMRGGMTMVSDLFDTKLKSRIDGLCDDLALLLEAEHAAIDRPASQSDTSDSLGTPSGQEPTSIRPLSAQGDRWWPDDLGHANSTGAQNGMRYAYFASSGRLALDTHGDVTVYDTLDHHISGVSQHQSGSGEVTFSSQRGTVDVATLPVVGRNAERPVDTRVQDSHGTLVDRSMPVQRATSDIVMAIEQLADLHAKGILTETEFVHKKKELLARL